jgi:hypothetical protein
MGRDAFHFAQPIPSRIINASPRSCNCSFERSAQAVAARCCRASERENPQQRLLRDSFMILCAGPGLFGGPNRAPGSVSENQVS